MALINGLYIHVTEENVNNDVEVSEHTVEDGINTTDTVKPKATEITLHGKIVDVPLETGTEQDTVMSAFAVLQMLRTFQERGILVAYSGRNTVSGYQITSFGTSHGGDVAGGADFDMTLRELRTASNSYTAPTVEETEDASDAVKDGGAQSPESGDGTEVWYTTQNGDTIWGLVAAPNAVYRNLKREGQSGSEMGACNWVMEHNPSAFSRYGDFRTLQNGVKILLGSEV